MERTLNELIKKELRDYRNLVDSSSCKTVSEFGFQMICSPGVMPPNNRVTRCFGQFLSLLSPMGKVLELGCGSGILSLIVAQKAKQVIGVDTNILAIENSNLNAALNRVCNVIFFEGDGYNPVQGQQFDLIFSNPPFYWSSESKEDTSVCVVPHPETPLIYKMIKGIHLYLKPEGKLFFVTSSFSENDQLEQIITTEALSFSRSILHRGAPGSQDIILWEIGSKNSRNQLSV